MNMQDNPQYNLPRRDPTPQNPTPPKPQPHVHRMNGGEVYEDERSMYEAYSQIHHQRPPPPHIGQGTQPLPPYDQVPGKAMNHLFQQFIEFQSRNPITISFQSRCVDLDLRFKYECILQANPLNMSDVYEPSCNSQLILQH